MACRALGHLSPAANAMGEWEQSLRYCERALAYGQQIDDLRIKTSALVRLASTYAQKGDWETALRLCDQAEAMGPAPFDAAALRAVRGFARSQAGAYDDGITELRAALRWYDQSNVRYTRGQFALWLAEACFRRGDVSEARRLVDEVVRVSQDVGYRQLERLGRRLLREMSADGSGAAPST